MLLTRFFAHGDNTMLIAQGAPTNLTHTGDAVETTLLSVNIPIMAPNDQLYVWSLWTHSGGVGTWTNRLKIGTTLISGGLANNAASATGNLLAYWCNRGATNSQVCPGPGSDGIPAGATSTTVLTTSIETNGGVTLNFTGQLTTTTDTIALAAYYVALLKA